MFFGSSGNFNFGGTRIGFGRQGLSFGGQGYNLRVPTNLFGGGMFGGGGYGIHQPPQTGYDVVYPDGRVRSSQPMLDRLQQYGRHDIGGAYQPAYPDRPTYYPRQGYGGRQPRVVYEDVPVPPGYIYDSPPPRGARPYGRPTNPYAASPVQAPDEVRELVHTLDDMTKATTPEQIQAVAARYAQAAARVGGANADLQVPPQGFDVPASGGHQQFKVWGAPELQRNGLGAVNTPTVLADWAFRNTPEKRDALRQALAQGEGQARPAQPQTQTPPAANQPGTTPQAGTTIDLRALEAELRQLPKAQVLALQSQLEKVQLGHKEGYSKIDGIAGPLTTRAVADYAKSHNLNPRDIQTVMGSLQQEARGAQRIVGGADVPNDAMVACGGNVPCALPPGQDPARGNN